MYTIDYSITTAREVPNPLKRTKAKVKPLTSRLRKSKNFWKLDRSLDDYIDRTDLIKCGPKRLLRKLLFLRPSEDSNEVKVTANGLSKLMNVNVKTIRSWLKALEKAEFIYFQGNVWDKGCNYPKKKYIFPATFPGFDLATVFIQKGAKAKYKKRMADPVKAKAKLNKMARMARKNTCPVVSRLVDCPSFDERETQNSKEDTKVSSSEILVNCPASAQPTPASCKFKKTKTVLDYAPELKDLLIGYLREHGHRGKLQWVSNFIEQEIRANKNFRFCDLNEQGVSLEFQQLVHELDRRSLARDLSYVVPILIANRAKSKHRLTLLFRFLRDYIAEYCPDSLWRSPDFNQFRYEAMWKEYEDRKRFFREFPFCESPDVFDPIRTGVNW